MKKDGFYPHGIDKGCGYPLHYVPTKGEHDFKRRIRDPHPYEPFESEKEFNLAAWFIESGLPGAQIDRLLKGGVAEFPLHESLA